MASTSRTRKRPQRYSSEEARELVFADGSDDDELVDHYSDEDSEYVPDTDIRNDVAGPSRSSSSLSVSTTTSSHSQAHNTHTNANFTLLFILSVLFWSF